CLRPHSPPTYAVSLHDALPILLTTVRMVAPAPGMPPKMAAMPLPMPWPISSFLGLCLVLVILSATTEVSRESMDPSSARVRAVRSEEHTSELQSRENIVCRLLL